ncbi:MAG: DUF4974 domain-containing protein [Acinetobacter sp.]|nr:MAG: DUF4974 domain-containing protein [Acinetobacter sp.]
MENNKQRLDFLIAIFQQGKLNAIEHQELLALLALPEHQDKAALFLAEVWESTPTNDQFFNKAATERLHQHIQDQIKIGQPKVKRLNSNWLRIAAAAVIVFVFAYALYQQRFADEVTVKAFNSKKAAVFVADAAPGGNRATLKLADNHIIVLDQVKEGVLVNLGNLLVKKLSNGQLVFEVSKTASNSETALGDNVLTTPAGGQYQVALADGSRVWLNASSSLRFPSTFTGSERRVELVGEGYFEISKSKDKPFIVNAKEIKVEVLGTHFNVNAYPDEQNTTTTLVEGSVKVSHQLKSALLKPNEQTKLKNGQFEVRQIDVADALAWKEGYFVFDNEEIHSVMRKLSRWYNVKVEYEDNSVNEEFVGTISKFKNITEILKLLQATGTINFKVLPSTDPRFERRVVVMK